MRATLHPVTRANVIAATPPCGRGEMVTLEGTAPIPFNRSGPEETERPKPALPGTRQEPETARARDRWGGSESNHDRTFFRPFLRPARLLRELRTPTAKSFTALLLAGMPTPLQRVQE